MFRSIILIAVVLLNSMTFNDAKAADYDSSVYSDGFKQQSFQIGQVIDLREVQIHQQPSRESQYAGASVGGLLGGALGSTVHGNARYPVAAALGVLGAIAGSKVSGSINDSDTRGFEVTVDLGNNHGVVVVQKQCDLAIGDRVRLITGTQGTRVVRIGSR